MKYIIVGTVWDEWVDKIRASMREGIIENIAGIFDSVNEKTASVGAELSKTPQGWNGSIFSMIQNLSDTVILPIATVILTLVLCYEIVELLTASNNMHEIDISMFAKIFLKCGIAVFVLSHTFEISMSIFDVAQSVISKAAGVASSGSLQVSESLVENLNEFKFGGLVGIFVFTFFLRLLLLALGIAIMIVLYGRFIEIYLFCSIAPIPFATFANKEWGQIGFNYVRGLFALAFQGFFMLLCVAIYAVLIQDVAATGDIYGALMETSSYAVILVLALFKTKQISQSIFNAH